MQKEKISVSQNKPLLFEVKMNFSYGDYFRAILSLPKIKKLLCFAIFLSIVLLARTLYCFLKGSLYGWLFLGIFLFLWIGGTLRIVFRSRRIYKEAFKDDTHISYSFYSDKIISKRKESMTEWSYNQILNIWESKTFYIIPVVFQRYIFLKKSDCPNGFGEWIGQLKRSIPNPPKKR